MNTIAKGEKKMDKIKVLFRAPVNQPLKLMEIENELDVLQKLIGGYIQVIEIGHNVLCILDEEGRFKESKNNFYHDRYGWIIGNVIFCNQSGEDFTSLTDEQIKFVKKYIGFPIEKA